MGVNEVAHNIRESYRGKKGGKGVTSPLYGHIQLLCLLCQD